MFTLNCNSTIAQWTEVSNNFGGEVQCFASSGVTLFAGSDGGGVFLSSDNGLHWNSIISGGLQNKRVHALLASPSSQGYELLAGTSGGSYLSTNTGAAWLRDVGLADTTNIHTLLLNGSTLFAGTSGGVYRAKGAANWERIDTGFTADYYVNTFILSDTNLLAGTFVYGVWRSVDSGSNWDQSNSGLTKSDIHAFAEHDADLFTATDGAQIFFSNDNGHNWSPVGITFSPNSINTLVFNGSNLFAGSDIGIYRTTDRGDNWTAVNTGLTNVDVRFLYVNSGFMFAAIGDSTLWRRPLNEVLASVKENNLIVSTIKNYSNPFSEKTTITFSLSDRDFVQVTITNLLGREVVKLFSGEMDAGEHSFIWDATSSSDGMYECMIRMNQRTEEIPILKIR